MPNQKNNRRSIQNDRTVAVELKPILRRRTFDTICQRIREELAAGALKPGDKLPAERQLAEQLGVGRSALREALRSLETAGVIRLKKGVHGGAFIREGDPSRATQMIEDLLHLGSISLENLTEARVLIQDVVVRLACKRATWADLEALDRNIELTEKLTRERRFSERIECSTEFYRLLAAAAHNPVLSLTVDAMASILLSFLRVQVSAGVSKPRIGLAASRRRFVALLRAHDAEGAIQQMKLHLISVHRQLTRGMLASARKAPRREVTRRAAAKADRPAV